MFYWIYDIPTWKLVLLFSGVFVAFTWFGSVFLRPLLVPLVRSQSNRDDIVGYVLSCFCVFYGLLLGLVAVAAYQNFSAVEATVAREASSLGALYRDVSSHPEPSRQAMQSVLREYTRFLVEQAWPVQQGGELASGEGLQLAALQEVLRSFEPRTSGEEVVHAEAFREFNEYVELRDLRLQSVTTGIPAILWYVVVMGAFLTVLIVWMFDMRLIPQLFLGGVLAFFIATVISLIAAMDNPYRGEFSVSSDPFKGVFERLMASRGDSPLESRDAAPVALKSAGATLPASLYREWFARFHEADPEVSVTYDAVGSGEGVEKFLAGEVDFAASDTTLSDEQVDDLPRGAIQIPVAAGMVGLVYNLSEVKDLRLSREALAGIFLGEIVRWDDPRAANCNPDTSLPATEITLVARNDASGTTHLLANHLSATSQEWKEKHGPVDLVNWPEQVIRAKGNEGVVETVLATPGAIGYVDIASATRGGLRTARLENRAGNYLAPSADSGILALSESEMSDDLRIYLPDPEAAEGYPIIGYTWLLVYHDYDNPQTAHAVKQLVRWCLLVGQNECETLDYLPIPAHIVSQSMLALEQMEISGMHSRGRAMNSRTP